MSYVLTDIGEEHFVKNGLQVSFSMGLYDDDTDAVSDTTDLPLSSEADNANSYARQSVTIGSTETDNYSGDWGFQVSVSFDTSTNSETSIDGTFAVVNFASEETGDGGSATDHLHSTHGPFGTQRDLSNIDTLDVTITVTVT